METREQIKQVNIALSGTLDLYRIWAKRYQLNYNELVLLYTLDGYPCCTQKQICQWWALPKQTVHGILSEFEKKDYITTSINPENKREKLLSFTDKGKVYASSVLTKLYQAEETVMLKLGAELRSQLIESNKKYYELLKEEIQNE